MFKKLLIYVYYNTKKTVHMLPILLCHFPVKNDALVKEDEY